MIGILKERIYSFRYDENKKVSEKVFNSLCKLAIKNILFSHNLKKDLNNFLKYFWEFRDAIGAEFRQNIIRYTKHKYQLNNDNTISLIVLDLDINKDVEIIKLLKEHWDNNEIDKSVLNQLKELNLITNEIYDILNYDLEYLLKGNSGGGWGAYFGGSHKGKGKPDKDTWAKIRATMEVMGLGEYADIPETWGADDLSVLTWLNMYWADYAPALTKHASGLKIVRRIVRWAAANGYFLMKY